MIEKKHVLLIINPMAGKKRVRYELYGIVSRLENAGMIPTVYFTEYRGHAAEIAASANESFFSAIICSGGDGTLNEVITGMMRAGITLPVGYIPSGSTCDFASTLGMSRNMQTSVRDIVNGKPKKIDVGELCGNYFSYVASFGIFTKASYSTEQAAKNLLGNAAYVLEGIKDLGSVHEHVMRIEPEGGEIMDDVFLFGAVANSTSIGGIISIDPSDVALNDGEFEYLFVKIPDTLGDLLLIIDSLSSGIYDDEHIYFGRTRKLKVTSTERLDWSLDGERVSTPEVFEIRNIHEAFSLILPEKSENTPLLSQY